ncbi:MurT ligase domain-containing protein [Rhodococcus sp. IEGM 1408]|uniref:MurT ligase domain-containing protein n=1 Tax=Rhodococcus sp. IEGM 1408 TaxID=3082220 RepID=UPI002953C26E|nr:MurT ligase domain-containing protein [Rhodococcus sp. IEGM 1408]MDV8002181.1 MurT ligase domain-containing protein [Rhodococcus sp. IEGM 1408]
MSSRADTALTPRGRAAVAVSRLATWASRVSGRGSGGMIGGLVALKLDPDLMRQLAAGRRTVLVTGTNGKSTTTRMVASALSTVAPVASNTGGDNMDAGIVSALSADRAAPLAAIEVDELHTPAVAVNTVPEAIVLLNLSRDQLDRVGEINSIERRLRAGVAAQPQATVVANCDDVMITSVAYDNPSVVWVAAGAAWAGDSVSCPRTGEPISRSVDDTGAVHWRAVGTLPDGREFARPRPDWWITDDAIFGPDGFTAPMHLAIPGRANRGNAAQAVAAAVAMGADPAAAVRAVETVDDVAGRYSTVDVDGRNAHLLLAKNPAGWQEALGMIDTSAEGLVIAVNGQVADGVDLSWLWDVRFESFEGVSVYAAGERAADLSVRLTYAGVEHQLEPDPLTAIQRCPTGRVEVLANYTAFRDLGRAIAARGAAGAGAGAAGAAGAGAGATGGTTDTSGTSKEQR